MAAASPVDAAVAWLQQLAGPEAVAWVQREAGTLAGQTAIITFFTCVAIYAVLSLLTKWTSLQKSYAVSTVHALVSTSIGLTILRHYWPDLLALREEVFLRPNFDDAPGGGREVDRALIALTGAYMLFDILLGLLRPGLLTGFMVFHHGAALFGAATAFATHFAMPLKALFIINEGSTPFVNFHAVMRELPQYKDEPYPGKAANGACMFLSFGIFRLALNSVLCVLMIRGYGGPASQQFFALYCIEAAFVVALQCLNLHWFRLIALGLFKALGLISGPKGKKGKKAATGEGDAAAKAEATAEGERTPLIGEGPGPEDPASGPGSARGDKKND